MKSILLCLRRKLNENEEKLSFQININKLIKKNISTIAMLPIYLLIDALRMK